MSNNKFANSKCFILSSVGYEEITYTELCKRREVDDNYKSKKFIPLHGMLMEVTLDTYKEFYKNKRRQKYLKELSIKNADFSIDSLTTDDFNGENVLKSEVDVAEDVINNIMIKKLQLCIDKLNKEEKELIIGLFYCNYSERELSLFIGIPQRTINDRKHRILAKLKKNLEN